MIITVVLNEWKFRQSNKNNAKKIKEKELNTGIILKDYRHQELL